jgi:hypothetical protein
MTMVTSTRSLTIVKQEGGERQHHLESMKTFLQLLWPAASTAQPEYHDFQLRACAPVGQRFPVMM